jgi:ATP-dependent exoDNAse (exonuclease V) alpha subunit
LAARLPVIELTGNRRQTAQWERETLALLRSGDVGEALRRYEAHGRVTTGDTAETVRAQLVADWWAGRGRGEGVMIAFRRVDVAELNARARRLMRDAGSLGGEELRLGGGAFARGDHVVLRSNDKRLGVTNGDRGTVVAINATDRSVAVAVGGRHVRLDADYLDRRGRRSGPSLQHGYAITGHSAQGLTCDEAFVMVTSEASREWSYTALSRGRQANRIYAMAPEASDRAEYAPGSERRRDARAALLEALERPAGKNLASDEDEQWTRRDSVLRRARDRGVGRGL